MLDTLIEVPLVEKRIRASVRPAQHANARYAHHHLADPFLQFYYRFLEPQRTRIALELYDEIEATFRTQLRSFVGYAFEALCRQWTLRQGPVRAARAPSSAATHAINMSMGAMARASLANLAAVGLGICMIHSTNAGNWAIGSLDHFDTLNVGSGVAALMTHPSLRYRRAISR